MIVLTDTDTCLARWSWSGNILDGESQLRKSWTMQESREFVDFKVTTGVPERELHDAHDPYRVAARSESYMAVR